MAAPEGDLAAREQRKFSPIKPKRTQRDLAAGEGAMFCQAPQRRRKAVRQLPCDKLYSRQDGLAARTQGQAPASWAAKV